MKKLITALAFTLFSLALPVLMAQQVAAQQGTTNESSVSVEIDGVSADQEDSIREAIESVGEVLGENVQAKLEVELSDLDKLERKEVLEALASLRDRDSFSFNSHGVGLGETVVAITAICLTLGLPVIILLLVLIFAAKKRRQMMELAGMYIKADQPLPEHVISEFGSGMNAEKRLRTGVQLFLIGIAVTIVLGTYAGEAATLGLIPIAIGLARIIYWRHERKNSTEHPQLGDHSSVDPQ